jgi:hypothetical protein
MYFEGLTLRDSELTLGSKKTNRESSEQSNQLGLKQSKLNSMLEYDKNS